MASSVLTDEDFADLTRMLMDIADEHAGGRLVSVLEGGYSLDGLAAGVAAHVNTLDSCLSFVWPDAKVVGYLPVRP